MELRLRPYQQEALDGIHEQLDEHNSTLMVLPTGTGKTHVVAHLAKDYMSRGRTLMLAHREELVMQAWRHLQAITGSEPDIEMGEYRSNRFRKLAAPLVVGTIQTQIAGKPSEERMTLFDPNDFGLLIIDEAHHSAAKSYRRVIEYYQRNPELKVIGITATPDRADEKALGQIFKSVAYDYELSDAIEDGWLVPIIQQSVFVEGLDYSSVRTTAGELNGADLAKVLEFEETLHGFASPIVDLVGDMKTLIFTASVAQAERLCEILNRHKPKSAKWVCGSTPKDERRALYPAYEKGEFQFLVNVGITTEGWDEPSVECVCLARPTKSRSLFAQMLGRGTRPLSNIVDGQPTSELRKYAIASSAKPTVTVLDFVGNAGRHRLITPSDILGGKYEDIQVGDKLMSVVERAQKNAAEKSAKNGVPVDVAGELDEAERELIQEAERARRQKVTFRAKYSTAKINPFNVFDLQPKRQREWNKSRQPSDKMLNFLDKFGVDTSGLSFDHAHQLIGQCISRREKGLCSYKQAKLLKRFGYEPKKIGFKEASALITEIKNNGWRRPA
jgi:superfamily II DNA or RNA helicase